MRGLFGKIVLAAWLVSFATSCATLSPYGGIFNREKLAGIKKVAAVSIYCDKRLDTSAMDNLASAINQITQGDKFDLSLVAEKLKASLFNKYTSWFPFRLIDEKEFISSENYRRLKMHNNIFLAPRFVATPEGYLAINPDDQEQVKRALAEVQNVDGVIYLTAKYKLLNRPGLLGFGHYKVICTLELTARDGDFYPVLHNEVVAISREKVEYSLGGLICEVGELQGLCENATNVADEQMKIWLRHNLANM